MVRQVACASPGRLEEFGGPDRPEALSDLPCVRFTGNSPGSVWRFDEKRKTLEVSIDGLITCNQVNLSVQACIDGLGFVRFLCYQVMPMVRRSELEMALQGFEALPASFA